MVISFLKPCYRRKTADSSFVKKVHHKSFNRVLKVVAKGHFVAAVFLCNVMQKTAAHSCTEGAGIFFFSVLEDDFADMGAAKVELYSDALAEFFDFGKIVGFAAKLWIEADRNHFVIDADESAQTRKPNQKRTGIFSAGNTDCDFIAVFDHMIIFDGFAHGAHQFLQSVIAGNGNSSLKYAFSLRRRCRVERGG